jgi:hypothetical protein
VVTAEGRSLNSSNSQFDASAALAGYLYQCRLGLLLSLRELKKKPNCQVSIEKFDDVAFHEEDYVHCILQAKHHIGKKNLTNSSVDIWKTIRIWTEQFQAGVFKNSDTKRLLITTAAAPNGSAMAKLRVESTEDERAEALVELQQAAKKSTNQSSKAGREAFLALTDGEANLLLSTITVLDKSPNLHDVLAEIEGELQLVSAGSADKVAQGLEGWWLGAISKRLVGDETTEIPVQHIAIKAQELAGLYGPQSLPLSDPAEFGEKPYHPDDEDQMYVKQMRLIQLGESPIRRGIQDYYKSNAQRSRWARENLLLDGEVLKYEQKLRDQWERRFDAECGDAEEADDAGKREMGRKVFFWATQHQVDFRNVVETWITAGSFHNLADRSIIGWHPHYGVHFKT